MNTGKMCRWLVLVIGVVCACATRVFGISCGFEPTDPRFFAVCGLAPRDREFGELWYPEGSGTYVQWVDGQGATKTGIVAARHFIDANKDPASGQCVVAVDGWYAYFKGCVIPPPGGSCASACTEEDTFRMRVKCWTLAAGAYDSSDGVVVGMIEPADVPCLSHITPIKIESPIDLDVCRGDPMWIAGWGETRRTDCTFEMARCLHIAQTTLLGVRGDFDGRSGAVIIPQGICTPCIPGGANHDSGGGMFVEVSGSAGPELRLFGVFVTSNGGFLAVRHQFFSDPNSTELLCRPCRPHDSCVDLSGPNGVPDGRETIHDRNALVALGQRSVACWCHGDTNGNGCAGDPDDIASVNPGTGVILAPNCNANQWCYGDANLDGAVNQDDLDFIESILFESGNNPVPCPACESCEPQFEWCRGDVDCSGSTDLTDLAEVTALLAGNPFGYQCSSGAPGCSATSGCP